MSALVPVLTKVIDLGNPFHILQNIWHHRYLIEQMIRRDLSQRYKGSFLGIIWSIINPLIMLLIYTFVFSVVFKSRWRPDVENVPMGEFALTLFAGLIPFNLFSEVVNRSPGIVVGYPNYVKKVVFPLEILSIVIAGTAFINSLISLGVLLVASLVLLGTIPTTIFFLPLLYIPLILLSTGLSWFLSSWGVYIRDVGQIVSVVTQVLFFMTPIFYSLDSVPEQFQAVLQINPLSMIVTSFRQVLLWAEMFPLKEWAIWTGIGTLIAIFGYIWFMGTKKGFADVL